MEVLEDLESHVKKQKQKQKKASIMALFTLFELLNMKFVQMQ